MGIIVAIEGADGVGKQELDPALLLGASLWADLPTQSIVIGEFQRLPAALAGGVQPIGGLISGRLPGRCGDEEITIYDSSGVALQDLAICALALERAQAEGSVQTLDLS